MRSRLGRGNGHGGLLLIVAVVAAVALLGEGLFALVISGETFVIPETASAPLIAAQRGSTSASAIEQAEPGFDVQVLPRMRVHLDLPRLPFWPSSEPPAEAAPQPALPPPSKPAVTATVEPGRVSAAALEAFLRKQNSPMMGMGQTFWERGRQYNVDPRLLVAISGNETGYGRILTSRYNPFNWFYQGTWDSHYDSWQEAIESVTRGIRQHYLDEGRTTVAKLGEKYGPIGAANDPLNLNVNFVPNVTSILREMGGDPERLTFN